MEALLRGDPVIWRVEWRLFRLGGDPPKIGVAAAGPAHARRDHDSRPVHRIDGLHLRGQGIQFPLPASNIPHAGARGIRQQSRWTWQHLVRRGRVVVADRDHGGILKLRGVLWTQVRRPFNLGMALLLERPPSDERAGASGAPRMQSVGSESILSGIARRHGAGGWTGTPFGWHTACGRAPADRPRAPTRMIRRRLGKRCRIGPRAPPGATGDMSPEQRVVRAHSLLTPTATSNFLLAEGA